MFDRPPFDPAVEKTRLFSPGENAIARELGAVYPERWRRVP